MTLIGIGRSGTGTSVQAVGLWIGGMCDAFRTVGGPLLWDGRRPDHSQGHHGVWDNTGDVDAMIAVLLRVVGFRVRGGISMPSISMPSISMPSTSGDMIHRRQGGENIRSAVGRGGRVQMNAEGAEEHREQGDRADRSLGPVSYRWERGLHAHASVVTAELVKPYRSVL